MSIRFGVYCGIGAISYSGGMSRRGCEHFVSDINRLIERLSQEYDMSYAEIVGCLEMVKQEVIDDAFAESDEEEV